MTVRPSRDLVPSLGHVLWILGSPWPASLASPGSPYSQPAANSSPGLQKALQKSLKSSLESSKFMKKSKKQNLSKTSVFTMFYTHPSIRSCHDFQPRTTEKSIPQPMQQIWYPKVSKMTYKWVSWEPRIDQKSTKNQDLGSKVSCWTSPVTMGQQTAIKMMTQDPKNGDPRLPKCQD